MAMRKVSRAHLQKAHGVTVHVRDAWGCHTEI